MHRRPARRWRTRRRCRDSGRPSIGALPDKERVVLTLYYYEELNLRQIAEILHVTESRISQIRTQALKRLGTRLTDRGDNG